MFTLTKIIVVSLSIVGAKSHSFLISELQENGLVLEFEKFVDLLDAAWGGTKHASDLQCNFNEECCWKNGHFDQLQFSLASGKMPKKYFGKIFGTRQLPKGRFLLLASLYGEHSDFEATLISCPIICTEKPVKVTLRHWRTKGVILQVCVRDSFYDHASTLLACRNIPRRYPGPSTVTLPPGEGFEIVIVARNLTQKDSLVLLDDIKVDFKPCPDEPVVMIPKGIQRLCKLVPCDYEEGLCPSIKPVKPNRDNGQGVSTNFEVASGKFGNRVTGIDGSSEGQFYIAAELKIGEKAAVEVHVGDLEQPVVMRVMRYTATQGIQMLGCCDTLQNCPLITSPNVTPRDKIWIIDRFLCPKGTQKIMFACSNLGENVGSCGIDDIKLFYPDPIEPEDTTKAVVEVCEES